MFVTLEGLDGSGTTSLLEAIVQEYPSAVTTAEPSDREYGQLVRDRLSQPDSDPLIDFYLFMADRRDHIENVIRPALDEGSTLVVSDRYADSTRAYQPVALSGEGKPFGSQWITKDFIERQMNHWNLEPDLTIYLDISVETAIERADGDEKYEQRQFLQSVKDNYDALADANERIVRVDAEQPIEEVRREALGKIDVVSPDRL